MADIQHYERVIKKKSGVIRTRILLILFYILILAIWIIASLNIWLGAVSVVLAALTELVAILLTWNFTRVEYEYSFVAGIFTFSKIYGSSRRKTVFEAELKTLVSAVPYDTAKFNSKKQATLMNALPDSTSPNPCVCLFESGDGEQAYIIIDCDAATLRVLRFFKASAVDRRIGERIEKAEIKEKTENA